MRLQGKLLHIAVVIHVLIHSLSDNPRSLLSVRLAPLLVPFRLALRLLFLVKVKSALAGARVQGEAL